MLATRRSGSNLLLDCLNSVPGVSFGSEVLHDRMYYGVRRRWISKRAVLRHIAYSLNDCKERICGCKIIMLRMQWHRLTVSDLVEAFPNARFIILYRKSLIDQFVSLRIAEVTGEWVGNGKAQSPPRVHVDLESLKVWAQSVRDFYAELLRSPGIRGRSVVISYEELTADLQKTFDQALFPFLQLPPSPVATQLKKQNTRPLSETVENYGEIEPLLTDPNFRLDIKYPMMLSTQLLTSMTSVLTTISALVGAS